MPLKPENPTVSIVITCYNYGRFVTHCLNSVMAQTFQDFEVIVVDDGSTDDTPEKVRPFQADQRITYIRQANGGQANAKNRGIRESKGRFVAFLDADDAWHPEKLTRQLPLFDDRRVGVVYSRAQYVDAEGNDLDIEIARLNKYLYPREGMVLKYLLCDNFVPFSSAVVRRRLLGDGFSERVKMAIDWELWLKISLAHEFREVPEKLLFYRMGHAGQMSTNCEERMRSADAILDQFICKYGHMIKREWIGAALSYKYYLRAEYYSTKSLKKSLQYSFMGFKAQPFALEPYKGVMKNLIAVYSQKRGIRTDMDHFRMIVKKDIHRYAGNNKSAWLLLWKNPGLRYTFCMRFLKYARQTSFLWPLFFIVKLYYSQMTIKYGIDIPYNTKVGPGLYIGHYGGIVVNAETVVGNNCNINHGVTLGVAYGGKYPGCPKIGDNVFLGAGCKVFGGIKIGNDVAVGANSVVTRDVPHNAVVAGMPAKIISNKGSAAYVVNTV